MGYASDCEEYNIICQQNGNTDSDDDRDSNYYKQYTYLYDDDEEEDDDDDDDDEERTLGLALESLNLGPKKKLLVFSINGLLIHRAHRKFDRSRAIPDNRLPDHVYNRHRLVYKRPYLDEFMKFCFERFEVGLWSSAQEQNIDGILDCAFKDVKDKFLFVWDQDQCCDTGFKSLEKKEKPLFLKDLSLVWSTRGRFSESNTLLIDDQPYRALRNPPNTGMFPKTYDPNDATDDALDPKNELGQYLEGLVGAEDVPSYVKERSFGQPAVGPDHPNWDFYSRVLVRLK